MIARRVLAPALALAVWPVAQACTSHQVVGVEIGTVTMHPSAASLVDGQSLQFTATVTDAEGVLLPGATVTWATDDPQIASIDERGLLEALQEGTATVRASFRGVAATASVAVLPAPAIVLSEDSLAILAVAGAESPPPVVIQVLNSGVGTIGGLGTSVEYAGGEPTGWLSADLASTEAPTSLTLTPATLLLPGGAYDATVVLDSDLEDGPILIPVSLSVTGISVAETGGSTTVAESGITDSVTVVLDAKPLSDVVVEVVAGDETEVMGTPTRLTFTPSTWDLPQTVTLTGQDDPILDGDVTTPVAVVVVDAESDPAFAPVPDRTVLVSTLDDETAGFTVVESDGATIVTGGGSDDFTVVLDVQPSSDVVIAVQSGDPTVVGVSPTTVTFTPQDWASPRVVVVTGAEGGAATGLRTTDLTLSVDDALSNDGFDALPDQVVTVFTVVGLTVTESDGSTTVTEAGDADDITVELDAEPSSNVVVDVVSADESEVRVSPERITFKPSNWDEPVRVTVTGPDDPVVDGDTSTPITLTVVDADSDPGFTSIPDKTVLVSTLDDEIAGFIVKESKGGTLLRDEHTDKITVELTAQPLSNVVIDVRSDSPDHVLVSPATLTFTPEDWDERQTVVVAPVGEADERLVTTITLSVDDALSDDHFDSVPDQVVTVVIRD